jgi:serine protease Do
VDLALVKVNDKNLVAARFGDSDRLAVGEWVIAIGNPYGFDHTVTVGVISAKGRSGIGAGPYEDFLQTDAAINPGNSGGPLVNLDGEVVGVNTAIKGVGTMIGFAIPASMAKPVSAQLIATGHVQRPHLGIFMQDVTQELSQGLGRGAPSKGAIVGQLEEGSPAAKAGVQPGDVIVKVNGQPVDSSKAVQRAVLGSSLGKKLSLEVWRNGKALTLAAMPASDGEKGETEPVAGGEEQDGGGKLGLELQSLTPDLAQRLGVKEPRGAVVAGVRDGSPAAEAGIREGDVIVEVDRQKVTTAEEAQHALVARREGGHLLRVKRGGGALYVVVPAA